MSHREIRMIAAAMKRRGVKLTDRELAACDEMTDARIAQIRELQELANQLPPEVLAAIVATFLLNIYSGDTAAAKEELYRTLNVTDVMGVW